MSTDLMEHTYSLTCRGSLLPVISSTIRLEIGDWRFDNPQVLLANVGGHCSAFTALVTRISGYTCMEISDAVQHLQFFGY